MNSKNYKNFVYNNTISMKPMLLLNMEHIIVNLFHNLPNQ